MILAERRVLHFSVKYSSCSGAAFFRSIQGKIPRLPPPRVLSNAARDDFRRRFIDRDGQSHHHHQQQPRDKGNRGRAQWTALTLQEYCWRYYARRPKNDVCRMRKKIASVRKYKREKRPLRKESGYNEIENQTVMILGRTKEPPGEKGGLPRKKKHDADRRRPFMPI